MAKVKEQQITFEEALAQLEAMVRALEAGNLTLDQSLEFYQQGIELSRICSGKLREAETKVEQLTLGQEGLTDFPPADETKLVSGE